MCRPSHYLLLISKPKERSTFNPIRKYGTEETKSSLFLANLWLPFAAAYLALVRSLGINQFQSGSVKINGRFLVDGAFDWEERGEKKDNISEKG